MINDSKFHMWRTVFAVAHADAVVTVEEKRYMDEVLDVFPFSKLQRTILENDVREPQNAVEMYEKISDPDDRSQFFDFAQKMVWADEDFGSEEQDLIIKLQRLHVIDTDVDDLVGHVDLELEDGDLGGGVLENTGKAKEIVFSFKDEFAKRLNNE